MTIERIQVALDDTEKASALLSLLVRNTETPVERVRVPVPEETSVIVVDPSSFAQMRLPIARPDSVVLVSPGDPDCLKDAWEAGVSSVVSDRDPLDTLLMAVLSACLRTDAGNNAHLHAGLAAASEAERATGADMSIQQREET